MAVTQHITTDRIGRRRTIWCCDHGHWHNSHQQAVKCNIKHRGRS